MKSDKINNDLLNFGKSKSGGLKALEQKYKSSIEEVITINELINWMDDLSEEDINFLITEIDRYFKLEMNIFDE